MRFTKKLAVVPLVFALVFTLVQGVAFANEPIFVTVDGQQITFTDQGPVIVENRTLVPIRDVFEFMGFEVDWQRSTQRATLTRDGIVIAITIGSAVFTVNGTSHVLDVPAQIIGGRTLLPLRAVLESVGYELDWDRNTRTVIITFGDATGQYGSTLQELINQAASQARNQDRTSLNEQVEWRMLWLVYPNVRVETTTFQMTTAQRQYVHDVAENFRQAVESAVPYITIHNSIVFIEELLAIPRTRENMISDRSIISQQLIQQDLDRLLVQGNYDNVFAVSRMEDPFVFHGGFAASTITAAAGFSYTGFNLGWPVTIPDMERPTSQTTRVAIHEWLHTLEGFGHLLGIYFPALHGYLDLPQYANYEPFTYCPELGNWPWYQDFLQGRILYSGTYMIGMYPKMWRLTPRVIYHARHERE